MLSKIDRLLINDKWINSLPLMVSDLYCRGSSDHFGLEARFCSSTKPKQPFQFKNIWSSANGYSQLIEDY